MTITLQTLSLIEKHRPTNLDGLLGNTALKRKFVEAYQESRIPNAILLHGGVGCGKTTAAYIIARMILCDTHDACGNCLPCRTVGKINASLPDYTHLDCALEGTMDRIRAMVRISRYNPMFCRARVIVMDEVQELGGKHFKALHGALEHTAPRTVWIFVTSDINDLPKTIRSRCMKFEFKPLLGSGGLLKRMAHICQEEGVDTELIDDDNSTQLFKRIINHHDGYVRECIMALETVIPELKRGIAPRKLALQFR